MTEVLLVEDDLNLSEPLARALEREGYHVDVAGRGDEALEEAQQTNHDVIILDLGLPDMDGLDVPATARCRHIGTRPHPDRARRRNHDRGGARCRR